jgi:hypothetical protein
LTEKALPTAVAWSGLEDSVYVKGILYRLAQDTANHIYVITRHDTTLLSHHDGIVPQGVELVDLDQDGHQDIIVNLFSNTPGDQLYFLFDPVAHHFVPLRNSGYYANAAPVEGTGLCRSYNRSGCADYNWESWLFGIKGDSAYSIGHMVAHQCPGTDHPRIITYLSEKEEDGVRMDSIPGDTSMTFFHKKREFVEGYWSKNYDRFTPRTK